MAGRAALLLALFFVFPSLSAAKDNVALNAPVTAAPGWSSPSLANDGRVGESSAANCFHSSEAAQDLPGWWRVDLGAVYPLDDVTIHFFNNGDGLDRSSGTAVYVQNSTGPKDLCTTITESTLRSKTVSCPQTGQILELRKTNSAPVQQIALCEVQVFVGECASNTYRTGGACSPCGHCLNGAVCDKTTGACPAGCDPGWTATRCDTECNSGCQPRTCTQNTGDCTGGCVNGRWGPRCDQPCSANCAQVSCDRYTAACTGGCKEGWRGSTCNLTCGAGRYGSNCSNACGRCRDNAVCNHVTGNCPAGCEAGWDGLYCLQECSAGRYGAGCSQACGQCAGGEACDKKDGACTACQQGFALPLCLQDGGSTYNQDLGAGVGIGIGVSCLVALVIAATVFLWRRCNQSQGSGQSKQHGRSGENRNADSSVYYNTAQEVAEAGDKAPYESLDAATRTAAVPSHYEQMRHNTGTL